MNQLTHRCTGEGRLRQNAQAASVIVPLYRFSGCGAGRGISGRGGRGISVFGGRGISGCGRCGVGVLGLSVIISLYTTQRAR